VLSWFRESELDSTAELVDPTASPEDRALVAAVYRALERLPRDERLVWVLRVVESETLESIADLLGCSVSTVQRRLRAAQSALGVIR
jgi:RNA polymerase sigma factor (sigma-70 family)